jgi:hypothetical protein
MVDAEISEPDIRRWASGFEKKSDSLQMIFRNERLLSSEQRCTEPEN